MARGASTSHCLGEGEGYATNTEPCGPRTGAHTAHGQETAHAGGTGARHEGATRRGAGEEGTKQVGGRRDARKRWIWIGAGRKEARGGRERNGLRGGGGKEVTAVTGQSRDKEKSSQGRVRARDLRRDFRRTSELPTLAGTPDASQNSRLGA